jgi:hypothetical protein
MQADEKRGGAGLLSGAGKTARCGEIECFRRAPDFHGDRAERRAAQSFIAGAQGRDSVADAHGEDRIRIGAEFGKAGRIKLAEFAGRHVLTDPDEFLPGPQGAQHNSERKGRGSCAVAGFRGIDFVQGAGRQSAADGLVETRRSEAKSCRSHGKTRFGRLQNSQSTPQIGKVMGSTGGHLCSLFVLVERQVL